MKHIYSALLEVQGKVGPITKGHVNPAFRSKYAGLPDVLETILPLLQDAGVVLIQNPVRSEDKSVLLLETIFAHAESGEELKGTASIPLSDIKPQAYGSAMTYARRYSIMSMLGLMAEDDDGNLASGVGQPAAPPRPTTVPVQNGAARPGSINGAAPPPPRR